MGLSSLEGVGANDRGGSTTAEAFVVAASAVDTKEKYALLFCSESRRSSCLR